MRRGFQGHVLPEIAFHFCPWCGRARPNSALCEGADYRKLTLPFWPGLPIILAHECAHIPSLPLPRGFDPSRAASGLPTVPA